MLEATIEAIDAGGETAVRVQEIADAAAVQIPILYRYYGSRDGMIQAAQVERLGRSLDRELLEVKAAVGSATSATEFRALLDVVLASLDTAERRDLRWKRVNVIGSTYGRPALAAAVAKLDLEAFASWFAGQTLGRIIIELGDSEINESAWNSISADAVRHVLLG